MASRRLHRPDPTSQAGQVLDLIALHGEMTVGELVGKLGVTVTAVRVQVNKLLADGWLIRNVRRAGRGRPTHVLSISADGMRLFGRQFDDFSSSLLEEILAEEGQDATKRLLAGVSRRMAERLAREVGEAGSPAERARHVAEAMSQRGIMVDVDQTGLSVAMHAHTCPFLELAARHREICEMEQDMLSRVVGAEVKLGGCMLDGHQCCEFQVKESEDGEGTGTPGTKDEERAE